VYYLSDRLSEAHSLQLVWAKLERSSLTSCLTRRTQSIGKLPHKKNAVLPLVLPDGRSRVKNGSGNRYKQDPFQGTLPVGIRSSTLLYGW